MRHWRFSPLYWCVGVEELCGSSFCGRFQNEVRTMCLDLLKRRTVRGPYTVLAPDLVLQQQRCMLVKAGNQAAQPQRLSILWASSSTWVWVSVHVERNASWAVRI